MRMQKEKEKLGIFNWNRDELFNYSGDIFQL